jgi:Rad3-related DNA helicase
MDWVLRTVFPRLNDGFEVLSGMCYMGGDNIPSHILSEFSILQEMTGAIGFMESRYGDEQWVYNLGEDECTFRPLFASGLFQHSIMPLNKRHMLTSATMCPAKLTKKWLGLDDDVAEYSLDSPFAVERRPVYVECIAYLNKDNLDEKLPRVVEAISMILDDHSQDKGIIHSVSFALGQKIYNLLPPRHKSRILLHSKTLNKDMVMHQHGVSPAPTVIISPSMTEGVDLRGDLSRFTVIPKTPYPYLGDKWVKQRMTVDKQWYNWQIAKTVMQGVGRSVRSTEDYASAYILDGTFANFYGDNKTLFPKWFRKSVVLPS